ncbi:hypothetical protein QQF64_006734 [Cirrhinus molitorella]|uniref:Uncharacterized protein n=1 Tax=Cirrhinus molitorella TaxID=172907 RepID=A0ABR3M8Q8_9TELE
MFSGPLKKKGEDEKCSYLLLWVQDEREPFEQFVTDLRLLVKDCNYANSDEMIRDRTVFGIHSPKVQDEREPFEQFVTDLRLLVKDCNYANSDEMIRDRTVFGIHSPKCTLSPDTHQKAQFQSNVKPGTQRDTVTVCSLEMLLQSTPKDAATVETSVMLTTLTVLQKESDTGQTKLRQAFVNSKIGQKQQEIKFKLHIGSSANVIPLYEYTKLYMQCTLQTTSCPLYGYGGECLMVKGRCNLKCKHRGIEMVMAFYVVDTSAPPVLGLKGCIDFGLIKMVLSVTETQTEVPVLEKFADVFKGIGLFPDECTIHLDSHATPVVHPPRRIPLALHSCLKEELESMERQGVIVKVTEPTANSMVVTEKPRTGQLRVCLDTRDLNKAIKRPHYPLPTLKDVTYKLAGAPTF